MRSRAGSWDRKEGSHLQSLDPSRVALLESRSSTTITSAIVVGRLVPLELRRFGFRPGASTKRRLQLQGRNPRIEALGCFHQFGFGVCGEVAGQDCQTFDRDPGARCSERPTNAEYQVSKWVSQ